MKRLILCFLAIIFLCGCEKSGPEYLVSSMGFSYKEGEFNVCFEAVIINSENTEQELKLLKGKGETIEKAVEQIKRQTTQSLLLSHCGVIVLENSLKKEEFNKVMDYCYNQDQITLSTFFVKTRNPEKLLSQKIVSSACVGFDIMGLLRQNNSYKNRFYEVINSGANTPLPVISVKDGGIYFGK